MVLGSVDYIAPEQVDDPRLADIRADIYSLGCTLYFLLAGRPPFPDGRLIQKLRAHSEKTPRPLAEVRSDVPPELARVVERMMAKDPARRFQTLDEVARERCWPCSHRTPGRRVRSLALRYASATAGAPRPLCRRPSHSPLAPMVRDEKRLPQQGQLATLTASVGGPGCRLLAALRNHVGGGCTSPWP